MALAVHSTPRGPVLAESGSPTACAGAVLANAAFGGAQASVTTTLGIEFAFRTAHFAVQLVLTVMCFEFYLAKAGTVAPNVAEAVAPQRASDEIR